MNVDEEVAIAASPEPSSTGAVVGVGVGTVLAGARRYTFTCTTPPAWTTMLGALGMAEEV